jgi:hypothetical protein
MDPPISAHVWFVGFLLAAIGSITRGFGPPPPPPPLPFSFLWDYIFSSRGVRGLPGFCLFVFKNLFLFCFATFLLMKPCKTLFIHTMDLKNVQKNMKKEKGEFIGHQVSSNKMSKSLHVKNWPLLLGRPYFSMWKIDCLQ